MATNVIVEKRRNETDERLIRRFVRKCKKARVVETYREKTDHYVKPSEVKRLARLKSRRDQQKKQKQMDELFR